MQFINAPIYLFKIRWQIRSHKIELASLGVLGFFQQVSKSDLGFDLGCFKSSPVTTRWYPWGIQRLVSTYSNRQNSKCQDLPKLQWGGGGVVPSQNSKCQDMTKFQFSGGEGGCSAKSKLKGQRKICLNFNFFVFRTKFQNRVFLPIWSKNSGSLACLCITDSLSHTYVETNKMNTT